MIEIIVQVKQLKSGRISISPSAKVSEGKATRGECQIAGQLKSVFEMFINDVAKMMPGSSTAHGHEDIETLLSMEDMDLEGDGK